MKLEQVTLSSNSGGPLSSSWTANSQYTVKSAYLAHSNGSVEHYKRNILWKARFEEKCRFFAWTVIQNKIIMAKNLGVTSKFVSLCDLCKWTFGDNHPHLECIALSPRWCDTHQVLSSQQFTLSNTSQLNNLNFICILVLCLN